ncbi:MAG: dipeptidyl aminopeptidase/acylaminoacyl peptidase [Colwellia sp.]|jgi:dipeptidyl aminopeptidase/acylaminoacyl peptidase
MILSNIKLIIIILCTGFLFSCTTTKLILSPHIEAPENYELLPVRTFFANVDTKSGYKLSPNGKKMAWVEVVGDRAELFVKNLSSQQIKMVPTRFINKHFYWGDEGRYILLSIYFNKPIRHKIAVIDTYSSNLRADRIKLLLPKFSGDLTLQRVIYKPEISVLLKHKLDQHNPKYYVMNLSDLKNTPNVKPHKIDVGEDNITDLIIKNNVVIARIRKVGNSRFVEKQYNIDSKNKFATISTCHNITANIKLLSVDQDGFLNYTSNCESDTLQLFRIKNDLIKHNICELKSSCSSDVMEVVINPSNGIPQFSIYDEYQKKLVTITEKNKVAQLVQQLQGTIKVVSAEQNFNYLTIENSSHLGVSYYLLDLEKNKITLLSAGQLANHQSFIKGAEFIHMNTANNEPLYGYYYPAQINVRKNKPAVILLHGGPEERTYADYNKEAIFLSNRGYNVLSLNYRGSKGFGHEYQQQAYENIEVILEDIESASHWLINNKGINKDFIGFMGASYGGYLALLASKYKQNKCIVSINGIYDLEQTALTFQDNPANFFIRYYGGIHNIQSGKFNDYSPIKYNDYHDNNYLIIQSQYDDKIPFQSAIDFYDLLKKDNQVKFTSIQDSHDIRLWYNRLEIYRDVEVFLHQCLGGLDGGFDYYLLAKPFYE